MVKVVPAIIGGTPAFKTPATWPPKTSARARRIITSVIDNPHGGYAAVDAPFRTELEQFVAQRMGYPHAVATVNGTWAPALAADAGLLKRGKQWAEGRRLIVGPTFTFVPGSYAAVMERLTF